MREAFPYLAEFTSVIAANPSVIQQSVVSEHGFSLPLNLFTHYCCVRFIVVTIRHGILDVSRMCHC